MNYNPDLIATTLKMLGSLAIVLGGMFVAFHFMKKFMNQRAGGNRGRLIRVLANTYIGMKKSISLVEVPGAILVIGLTNDNMTLLGKIEPEHSEEILNRIEKSQFGATLERHLGRFSKKTSIAADQN